MDEHKKKQLYIAGAVASIVALVLFLRSKTSAQPAGQTLSGNIPNLPGGSGAGSSGTPLQLGQIYADMQLKEQQIQVQQQEFNAQLTSTDARAQLNANTQLAIASMNNKAKLESGLISGLAPSFTQAIKDLPKYLPSSDAPKTPSGLPVEVDSKGKPMTLGGSGILPSNPSSANPGWPSVGGMVGDLGYVDSPSLVSWLKGSQDVSYESPASATPVGNFQPVGYTPGNLADYFSATPAQSSSFASPETSFGTGETFDGGTIDLTTQGTA